MTWGPAMFETAVFETIDLYRRRPTVDLVSALPALDPVSVVDLGCGGGQLSRILAARWPEADVVGVDNSPAMLRWAAGTPSRVRYVQADLVSWRPPWNTGLLISNGGLHRVEDHPRLFPELLERLAPGGVLAVAMARTEEGPPHRLLIETARQQPWAARLADAVHPMAAHTPAEYYDMLSPLAHTVDIWETEYLVVLDGEFPFLQWMQGAALGPVMDRLEGAEFERFLAAYRHRMEQAYPQHPDGKTLIPMKRLFIVARAAG